MNTAPSSINQPRFVPLLIIGVAAGLLSGVFGVGGGTIIVPALMLWLGVDQRLAAGISVTAILPTAITGATTYALQGNVSWYAAICLAVGAIAGAQLGSRLLTTLKLGVIQWTFLGFLLVVVVSLWFVVPQREVTLEFTWVMAGGLIVTGLVTGMLAGLMGVGGGVVVVPALMIFFGASDLAAKGTSLLVMIPSSLSATFHNSRHGNINWRMAVTVGLAAAASAPIGAIFAGVFDPFWGNIALSAYLAFVFLRLLMSKLRSRK